MTVRHMRLGLGLFFLVAGAVLLGVRFGVPDLVAKWNPMRLFLGACLALAMGCWNLSKWYAGWMWYQQQATPVRRPFRPGPTADAAPEMLPEFDFRPPNRDTDEPARS
ncbi:hypothetical protein [Frigoriglobus tundricola]|uniref:Uncharacterized protein n=1 Tax=Frigoriglobus tundricola TaxID=2774151 RepID=A0A6M5YG61_9BACT|nr:hypothetical protein [Frigoriglobus tundricola]QJW92978.1 hypothetical protein FTUN_0476 [Frigoriglobus tundricola]